MCFKPPFNIKIIILLLSCLFSTAAYGQLDDFLKKTKKTIKETTSPKTGLSEKEIISGLKQALEVGVQKTIKSCSQIGGFYQNSLISIPFPEEAAQVESTVRRLGMNKQADDFVKVLNTAAERASKQAAQLFIKAISQMTVKDGVSILKGKENAATAYLRKQTEGDLTKAFQPIISKALQEVQYTKYWNPLASAYNTVPFVKKVNPDLESYVNEKAIKGIFTLVSKEEARIRKDPKARVTDLLKKVFN